MNLDLAIKLATEAHAGQLDKRGVPYILHPLRVMLAMKTEDERIVAALHDVVEAKAISCDDLYWVYGFSPDVVVAIDAVSRRPLETYFDYIRRAGANPIARAVKIADIMDNLDPDRPIADPEQAEKLQARYSRALDLLLVTNTEK